MPCCSDRPVNNGGYHKKEIFQTTRAREEKRKIQEYKNINRRGRDNLIFSAIGLVRENRVWTHFLEMIIIEMWRKMRESPVGELLGIVGVREHFISL